MWTPNKFFAQVHWSEVDSNFKTIGFLNATIDGREYEYNWNKVSSNPIWRYYKVTTKNINMYYLN